MLSIILGYQSRCFVIIATVAYFLHHMHLYVFFVGALYTFYVYFYLIMLVLDCAWLRIRHRKTTFDTLSCFYSSSPSRSRTLLNILMEVVSEKILFFVITLHSLWSMLWLNGQCCGYRISCNRYKSICHLCPLTGVSI